MAEAVNSLINVQYQHIMDYYWSVSYANVDLIIDEVSGFVNATKLCIDNRKMFHNWHRYNSDFVDCIDKIYGTASMYNVRGGNDEHRAAVSGTYVKSEIIIALSLWISYELYANVSKIIEDCVVWRLNNKILERDHIIAEQSVSLKQQNQAMVERDHTIAEQSVSLKLQNQAMVERDHTIAEQSHTIAEQNVSLEQMKTENIELNQTMAEQSQTIMKQGKTIVHQEQTIDEMAVDNAKFQRFKHDIAPKAESEGVHHVLCIVFKNEEKEEYPFYVIRSQKRSVNRQFAGVRKRYPRCVEIKRITYSPNAFNLFHRMKDFLDIRTRGNHVMLQAGYSPDRLPNDTSDLCVI